MRSVSDGAGCLGRWNRVTDKSQLCAFSGASPLCRFSPVVQAGLCNYGIRRSRDFGMPPSLQSGLALRSATILQLPRQRRQIGAVTSPLLRELTNNSAAKALRTWRQAMGALQSFWLLLGFGRRCMLLLPREFARGSVDRNSSALAPILQSHQKQLAFQPARHWMVKTPWRRKQEA